MELKLKQEENAVLESPHKSTQENKATMYDGKQAMKKLDEKRQQVLRIKRQQIYCAVFSLFAFLLFLKAAIDESDFGFICSVLFFLIIRVTKVRAMKKEKILRKNYSSYYAEEFVAVVVKKLF